MKKEILKISETKKYLERVFEKELTLIKVSCPLFVKTTSGLQDYLSGTEEAVKFMKDGESFEIVHSLAKWKRDALYRYGFEVHTGLYTDMKAIRKDEIIDDLHSIYVEQYDFEKIITKEDRTIKYLKTTVKKIYKSIYKTYLYLLKSDPTLERDISKDVYFIDSEKLLRMYPTLTPKEREYEITKEYKVVFLMKIGYKLSDGTYHDLRSPDYDDWELNGDLLVYDSEYDRVIELCSMGIRVDEKSLPIQLKYVQSLEKLKLDYHKKIMDKTYPLTIGGGLGISRVLMFLLKKKHVMEVQASTWPSYIDIKKSL